ncbi:DMT family transporter [Halochromatium salexigens]|uniref:EamA family transporter n=1 Tax=Halochromatium salexigens TaxID=49447 RepID=A0AAJ0UJ66_HALSE|nr:DMT family transporter [Halochromatium salexigens]MBK5932241.1 EamA family transporter [Halochromatium salexigens]
MSWLLLALLCAFSVASADAATKAWLQGFSARELTLIRFTLTGALLSPLLFWLPDPSALPAPFWGWLALLVPLEIGAMLLYMAAIRDHPLSLTLPYLAFTPVFSMVIAALVLGERVSLAGSIGVVLIVAGAWLLNVEHARRDDWRTWLRPLGAIRWEAGSRMMLGVALLYGLTSTLGKVALLYLPSAAFGALYFAVIGLLAIPLLLLVPLGGARSSSRSALRRLASRPGAVLAVAALNGIMVITHFMALRLTEVAYMIAVKRSSLLFGILYGVLLFREPNLINRLPGGLLMVSGVFVILLAG